ncbi:MAG: BamA/TamA family outer membrane protein [Acidobacteriota bacterium]|nr:BamA/TamA family outer membrane protein [Acidobacteriota bacterium]
MSPRTRFSAIRPAVAAVCLLILAAPAARAQYFGKNKIKYQDFDWRIYHSVHFDVHYYPEEEALLEKVVSFAESAYDELSRELDHQVKDPIPLIYYATHDAFEQNNIILNFIPEGVGAFAVPTRNRMVLPVDLPDQELMQLILHELTHVFQFSMLFEGRAAKGLTASPPTWFIEGMASYFAKDESARDRAYLSDAVVNDRIPPVTATNVTGFFAYRFGHAVFDYVEERWGKDGVRDLLEELRNNLAGQMGRVFERTFQIRPEDMDADFRRWLRGRYLPKLVETGEPGDFGRVFRREETIFSGVMSSPAPSPSGDLVAAFSTFKGDVDVVLYDTKSRELVRNLTSGFDDEFQYLVAQELTLGRKMGRDIAFSPDGNTLALFARQGRDRKLVLLDVLRGRVREVLELGVSQPSAPAWSPDGEKVAFGAYREGRFDIFAVDVASGAVARITDDDIFDGAPVYDPDGKSIVLTSVVGGFGKLFRVDLDDPSRRVQLTFGESHETDATFSPDGERLYYTSDRSGADNVYGLNLETGELIQHTNAVTMCFQPAVLASPDGKERLVYTAFWKGRLDVYVLDLGDPITPPIVLAAAPPQDSAVAATSLGRFEPSIEVVIDEDNVDEYRAHKFFLEDIDVYVGVSDDQTVIGQTIVSFTDNLGDRRIVAAFQGVEGFSQFQAIYADLSGRLQWNARLFDDETFFIGRDGFSRGPTAFRQLGAVASLVYPINPAHRFEVGAGYVQRDLNFQSAARVDPSLFSLEELIILQPALAGLGLEDLTPEELALFLQQAFPDGILIPVLEPRKDDYPIVEAALVGDTATYAPWGPISGRRWRLSASHAQDLNAGGTLFSNLGVDFRQYLKLTARSNFAMRLWGSFNEGDGANPVFFGGLDTLRGYDFRSIVGDQGFFGNFELRFPLFDQLSSPILRFGGVRALFFVDVGGAWFDEFGFTFWDGDENRLADAVASYGYGLSVNFLGIDLNFDFAKRWDFETTSSGFLSSFWIGTRF